MPRGKRKQEIETAVETPHVRVREQVAQMAPATTEELDNAPTDTDAGESRSVDAPFGYKADGTPRLRRANKGRTASRQDDPLMNDERYQKAIAGMTFFGAPRAIRRSFDVGAGVLKDESIKLTAEENTIVEDYFYAVSKHSHFDPMAHLLGRLILFVLLMSELILPRYLKHSGLTAKLEKLIAKAEENDNPTLM